mgnify:CR=1 FL=1
MEYEKVSVQKKIGITMKFIFSFYFLRAKRSNTSNEQWHGTRVYVTTTKTRWKDRNDRLPKGEKTRHPFFVLSRKKFWKRGRKKKGSFGTPNGHRQGPLVHVECYQNNRTQERHGQFLWPIGGMNKWVPLFFQVFQRYFGSDG